MNLLKLEKRNPVSRSLTNHIWIYNAVQSACLQLITSSAIVLMLGLKQKGPVVETFSSFSNDSVNQDGADIAFYREFIKENLFHTANIANALVKDIEGGKPTKPYAAYVVFVSTAHIEYTVERRYSTFRQLYKRLVKKFPLKTEFPSRTFLSNSTNEEVMNRRRTRLNNFISEVLACENKQNLVELLDFLEIKAKYAQQKILLPSQKIQAHRTDQQYINDLLDRLGNPTDYLCAFQNIEKAIFQERIKINSESIRQLFVGLGNRKGLLKFCIVNDNEGLVCLRALQLINRLLNFEQNRDAEVYTRTFVGCPPKSLKILPELLRSHQVKLSYFQLVDTYLKRNCELNIDELLDFFFADNPQEKQGFLLWSKIRCSNSLSVELFQEKIAGSNAAEIDEKVNWLLDEVESEAKEWRTLSTTQGKNYSLKAQECREGIIKFTFLTNKDEDTVKFMFINTMNWNNKVVYSKTDPYAKTLTVHMGGKQQHMRFKFAFETRKTGKGSVMIRKPISNSDFPGTFFQIMKTTSLSEGVHPLQVEVWEYYQSPTVKLYLQNQSIEGCLNPALTE